MKTLWLSVAAVCITLTTSCGNHRKSADWLTSDDVHIAVDETFRPIMEEEIQTYGLKYPTASMLPVYCSEHEALQLLLTDSLRSCIVTRKLSKEEIDHVGLKKLRPTQSLIATDAMALIVNKENKDTLITLDEIKGIISGRITRWEQLAHAKKKGELKLVFDNQGSSTVRYMMDSLNDGKKLSGNLFAQGSNRAVLDLVKENEDVIGVVGANWLKESTDSVYRVSFSGLDMNVMRVSRFNAPNERFFTPLQYYIATGEYPLLRGVYVITTDPRVRSLEKNFFYFLKGQNGQLIINKSSQMLTTLPVQVKDVAIRD